MKTTYKHWLLRLLSLFLVATLLSSYIPVLCMAAEDVDPIVVVSLGDSYSSGEGIPDFYGQDLPLEERVWNEDWLAHRSKTSWPSRLYVPGMPEGKTLGAYRNSSGDYQWYFGAVSGAETKHFKNEQQEKPFCVKAPGFLSGFWVPAPEDVPKMPLQLSIFDGITDDVDYVTLTVGGNDVDFTGVVKLVVHPGALYSPLKAKFKKLWENIDTHQKNLEDLYRDINRETNGTADIIVAGYPELFDKDGSGVFLAKKEATIINENVVKFNKEVLKKTIDTLQTENIKIHFVDVVSAFNGHQAYSSHEWINKIDLTPNDQDVDQKAIDSAYSVHPNTHGAQAYADCINKEILRIELMKKKGTLAGQIVKASDRTTPVTSAQIQAFSPLCTEKTTPNGNGNYSIELPANRYYVTVDAEGYIPFKAYAVVKENQTEYMQTFLMVEGEETDVGSAQGMITNALNGTGLSDVTLDVRNGWNNEDDGEILTTVTTDDYGAYLVTLPIGNYTLCASKEGFVQTMVNIIVQKSNSGNQNGSMTPIISGDNYRIVLTWGENPRDLDSHVVGTLTNGNMFHVYYSYKSQYDGAVEVCNLDYDDTTSYGPETITLNATTGDPYYYYIFRYAGSGTVAASGAQVKVYQGENVVATFNVPTDLGSDDYWNVFAVVDGQLVVRNTITSKAETTYANTNIAMFSLLPDAQSNHAEFDDRYPAKEGSEETHPENETSSPDDTVIDPTIETIGNEDVTEETEVAEATGATEETLAENDIDTASDTVEDEFTSIETETLYLDLAQIDQDYTWTVETPDAVYDVTETETEGTNIYSVDLSVDVETIILRGKNEETGESISSVEISLTDIQDNNCIVAVVSENEGEFEVVWGFYDSETGEVTLEEVDTMTITEEDSEEMNVTENKEYIAEPDVAEEENTEEETATEETKSDADILDDEAVVS